MLDKEIRDNNNYATTVMGVLINHSDHKIHDQLKNKGPMNLITYTKKQTNCTFMPRLETLTFPSLEK